MAARLYDVIAERFDSEVFADASAAREAKRAAGGHGQKFEVVENDEVVERASDSAYERGTSYTPKPNSWPSVTSSR